MKRLSDMLFIFVSLSSPAKKVDWDIIFKWMNAISPTTSGGLITTNGLWNISFIRTNYLHQTLTPYLFQWTKQHLVLDQPLYIHILKLITSQSLKQWMWSFGPLNQVWFVSKGKFTSPLHGSGRPMVRLF